LGHFAYGKNVEEGPALRTVHPNGVLGSVLRNQLEFIFLSLFKLQCERWKTQQCMVSNLNSNLSDFYQLFEHVVMPLANPFQHV